MSLSSSGTFFSYAVDEEAYDFVTALASLHHMPFAPAVAKMTRALRPGGVLAVLGVWPPITFNDKIVSSAAVLANQLYKLVRGPDRTTGPTAIPTMTLAAVRAGSRELLPGARRHLLWRYTIIWTKPVTATG